MTVLAAVIAVAAAAGGLALASESGEGEEAGDIRREAAMHEGFGKLMSRISALKITPTVGVGEFMNSSPALRPSFMKILKQKTKVEERRFRDGSREADLSVSLDVLVEVLAQCAAENKEAAKDWPPAAFKQIKDFAEAGEIEATGASNSVDSARSILGQNTAEPGLAWAQVKEPGSLKARSAAEENAVEGLCKLVLNLRLGPGSRLDDFIESPETRRRIKEFVKGSAEPVPMSLRYIEDLTCEIEMEVPVETVASRIEGLIQSRIDPGLSRLAGRPLREIIREGGRKILRATGLGFPPDEYLPLPARRRPPWARATVSARGEGFPPEDLPSSEAARNVGFMLARKDAAGKLLAEISGMDLGSGKTIGDLMDEARKTGLLRVIMDQSARDEGFGKTGGGYVVEIELNMWKIWILVREWR